MQALRSVIDRSVHWLKRHRRPRFRHFTLAWDFKRACSVFPDMNFDAHARSLFRWVDTVAEKVSCKLVCSKCDFRAIIV